MHAERALLACPEGESSVLGDIGSKQESGKVKESNCDCWVSDVNLFANSNVMSKELEGEVVSAWASINDLICHSNIFSN